MQMLQIFNEFAWLVHVGILDGVLKNDIQGVCWTTINNLTLRVLKLKFKILNFKLKFMFTAIFLKLNKKKKCWFVLLK